MRAGDGGEGRGKGAHNRDEKPQAGGDLSGQDGFLSEGGAVIRAGEEVESCPGGVKRSLREAWQGQTMQRAGAEARRDGRGIASARGS